MISDEKHSLSRRILVMEDDAGLVALYIEALTLNGFQVDGAITIQKARELLSTNEYDVFLCDVYMGRERSITMLREVMPTLKKTQVVMLSGTGQYNTMAQEIGIDFFMAKPVNIPDLVALIERLSPLPSADTPDQEAGSPANA
jgi:two-component system alkaline phosphatase synthesis response regulator PhoP